MKKMFIVADVHGFADELSAALRKAGWDVFNPNHVFVSLGDLVDRGPKPLDVLNFVNNLPNERKILIKGNHEDLIEQMLLRNYPEYHDFLNGSAKTVVDCYFSQAYKQQNFDYPEVFDWFKNWETWKKYINSCINYYEINNNIFVHGWIPSQYDWRNATTGEWIIARWSNGMREWEKGNIVPGETIWCGHWHTSYGHCNIHHDCENEFRHDALFTPFIDKGIVAMDACTALSGFINCEVIEV